MNLAYEFLESLGLLVCLLVAAPLACLRRIDRFSYHLSAMPELLSRRLFARLLRSRLDYRLGNYQQAVVGLVPLVQELESALVSDGKNPQLRQLLCHLYCDMQQMYVLCGQIADVASVVIRAHKMIGLDSLPSNPDLDVKASHVIKAGLAASKMLEDGGLATLMVRQGDEPILSRPQPLSAPKKSLLDDKSRSGLGLDPERGAVIIPFPSP